MIIDMVYIFGKGSAVMKDGDKFLKDLERAAQKMHNLESMLRALCMPPIQRDYWYWLDYMRVNKN